MFDPEPLIVDGRAPMVLPAFPMPTRARERRPLFVIQRTIYLRTSRGWIRIPRGYVTDFGSIPSLAAALSFSELQPISSAAWAFIAHDVCYAIGEPGRRPMADEILRDRMVVDQVPALRREIIYRAVRLGGQGGYDRAPTWWDTENFVEPLTGQAVPAPFAREDAYVGRRWGLRDRPDWIEP